MIRRTQLALALALAAAGPAHAQTARQPDFYRLGDYTYFPAETAPPPIRSTTATQPPVAPESAPVSPSTITLLSAPQPSVSQPAAAPAATSATVFPQGDMARAKEEAKALGTQKRNAAAGIPTTADLATNVPGYSAAPLPQETLFDNPDALVSSGAVAAASSDAYRAVVDPDRTNVILDRDTVARGNAVERDPNAYLSGQALASGAGACKPLPPGATGTGYYEATCNIGLKPEQQTRTCPVPLVVSVVREKRYGYYCSAFNAALNQTDDCTMFEGALAGGICTIVGQHPGRCLQGIDDRRTGRNFCTEPGEPVDELSCTAEVPGATLITVTGEDRVTESVNDSMCASLAADPTCTPQGEVCTSSDPVTRIVDGVPVTKPCWAWERSFQCIVMRPAADCGELEAKPQCSLAREVCLDDPQDGPCKVRERVYRCPLPGSEVAQPSEYICGDDVYCINGDCEPIVREASTEFKDALVGLHTLGQANKEFDEATLTLFSGARETCHRKLFGLSNCCSGEGVPLVTPFLCSAAERQLDQKDDAGLCVNVGSFCSDSVLGVCVTKKEAYCCFESKLSRILQEQGRQQLGLPWGKPKTEQCRGFTIDQFARLDLSRMDFTEVYAEFVDAAKLPDEVATAQQIQERIQQYYQTHKPR